MLSISAHNGNFAGDGKYPLPDGTAGFESVAVPITRITPGDHANRRGVTDRTWRGCLDTQSDADIGMAFSRTAPQISAAIFCWMRQTRPSLRGLEEALKPRGGRAKASFRSLNAPWAWEALMPCVRCEGGVNIRSSPPGTNRPPLPK